MHGSHRLTCGFLKGWRGETSCSNLSYHQKILSSLQRWLKAWNVQSLASGESFLRASRTERVCKEHGKDIPSMCTYSRATIISSVHLAPRCLSGYCNESRFHRFPLYIYQCILYVNYNEICIYWIMLRKWRLVLSLYSVYTYFSTCLIVQTLHANMLLSWCASYKYIA